MPDSVIDWNAVPGLEVAHFHPRSSAHRPATTVRLAYDDRAIHLRFDVADRYVLVRRTRLHDQVCRDSCVEFFVEPTPGRGYWNFEFNAGGTMLLYHVYDHRRTPTGFAGFTQIDAALAEQVAITTSLPRKVDPEMTEPVNWWLTASIPLSLFEHVLGPFGSLANQMWRGNFYKCADECSHPHWASWAPIGPVCNFHQPDHFAPIRFDP